MIFFENKTMWLLSLFFLWSSFPWSIRPSVDARRIWESFLNIKLSSGPVRKVKRNWRAKGARRALIRRERFWKGADWLSLGYVSPIHTAQKHLNHSPRWILGSKTKVTVRSRHWDPRNLGLGSFFRTSWLGSNFRNSLTGIEFAKLFRFGLEFNTDSTKRWLLSGSKTSWSEIRFFMACSNLTSYRWSAIFIMILTFSIGYLCDSHW